MWFDRLSLWAQGVSFETTYVAASAAVAVGIFAQMVWIRLCEGELPSSPVFSLLSWIDALWFLVSLWAFFFLDFDRVAICVPVVYGIYIVLAFVYGLKTMKSKKGDFFPEDGDDMVFDSRYLNFCQSFALVFFGFCVAALLSAYRLVYFPFLSV